MSEQEKSKGKNIAVQNKKLVGYIGSFFSMLLLATSIATSQFLAGSIPVFELNLWRFLFQALGALLLRITSFCNVSIPRTKWLLFCAVLISHLGFNVTFFTASIFLPAGNVGAYAGAALIIFNMFLSICIKSERIWHLYVSAFLSLLGIVLLAQPWFIFPDGVLHKAQKPNWTTPCFDNQFELDINPANSSTDSLLKVHSETDAWIGYILVAVSGICISISFLTMRKFVATENPFILAFWLGFFGSVISVVPMLTLETMVFPSEGLCILILLLHGVSSTQTVLCSPFCLQYLSPPQYSFIVTMHMAVLLALQYTVLSDIQPGNGNWVEILGGIICIAACLLGPATDIIQHRYKTLQEKEVSLDMEPKVAEKSMDNVPNGGKLETEKISAL